MIKLTRIIQCEPQINPEFKQSSQHRLGNGLRTEASFAEFSKKRAKRLGLSDDEHRKIGQTYSCIRQSRRNTEAEQRNCVRESFRGFEKERDLVTILEFSTLFTKKILQFFKNFFLPFSENFFLKHF